MPDMHLVMLLLGAMLLGLGGYTTVTATSWLRSRGGAGKGDLYMGSLIMGPLMVLLGLALVAGSIVVGLHLKLPQAQTQKQSQ